MPVIRLNQQAVDPIVLDSDEEDARPLRELNDVRRRHDDEELRAFDLRFRNLRDLGHRRNLPPPILRRAEAPPPYQARVLQDPRPHAAEARAAVVRALAHATGVAEAAAAPPAAAPPVAALPAPAPPAPQVENPEDFHSYVHGTIDRAAAGVRLRTTYIQTLRSIIPNLPSSSTKPRFKRATLEKLRRVIFCAGRTDPAALARLHEKCNVAELLLEVRRVATDNIKWEKRKILIFRADQQDRLLRASKEKESSLIAAKDTCRTVIRDLERLAGDV